MNVSVAVTELTGGVRSFHGSGKVEASTEPQDMRLQRMLGHSRRSCTRSPSRCWSSAAARASPPARSCPTPTSSASSSATSSRWCRSVVDADVREGELRRRARPAGPRSCYDDARHFLRTTREKFDIITSDPIDPWVKGAATLYTEGILRDVPQPPESGRRRHAVGAALREHAGDGQERDRDLLPGLPQRHDLGQRNRGRAATTSSCSARATTARST